MVDLTLARSDDDGKMVGIGPNSSEGCPEKNLRRSSVQVTNPEGTTLLRTSASSGHGIGTALSEQIEEKTDVFAFLFAQLGVKVRR
jgi:hypothetical protein